MNDEVRLPPLHTPDKASKVYIPPDRPNGGGTVYSRPVSEVEWFVRSPNGGTSYERPGNPYASIEEDPEDYEEPEYFRPMVTVELPEFVEES